MQDCDINILDAKSVKTWRRNSNVRVLKEQQQKWQAQKAKLLLHLVRKVGRV
jgi:hypothetical protein